MKMQISRQWYNLLEEEINSWEIQHLKRFLQQEQQQGQVIYPAAKQIFHAFALTPFENVKVLIMGQDPYHGAQQAHGLAFSVPPQVNPPPSLLNIFRELKDDLGIPIPNHGCLESWARQGVLLLNATLTVRAGQPRSHYGQGWEFLTDAIISKLSQRSEPLIFVLWGKSAQQKQSLIEQHRRTGHAILTAAHPSPYSAHHGFLGCQHFSKINQILASWGKKRIDWRL